MKALLVALLAFTGFSCGFTTTSQPRDSHQVDTANEAVNKPANGPRHASAYDNYQVWRKVKEDPDSVALTMQVNDSTTAQVVVSGAMLDSTHYWPKKITIVLSNGLSQTLPVKDTLALWTRGQRKPLVNFEDMNFDGSLDLHLFDNSGALNFWYCVYLYEPSKGFAYSDEFSTLACPKIDGEKKQILSLYHLSSCEESAGFYTVEKNGLQRVRYLYGEARPDSCIIYEKRLVNGEWKIKNLGQWGISLFDTLYPEPY